MIDVMHFSFLRNELQEILKWLKLKQVGQGCGLNGIQFMYVGVGVGVCHRKDWIVRRPRVFQDLTLMTTYCASCDEGTHQWMASSLLWQLVSDKSLSHDLHNTWLLGRKGIKSHLSMCLLSRSGASSLAARGKMTQCCCQWNPFYYISVDELN